jgi:mRNA interferase RelE/StbE
MRSLRFSRDAMKFADGLDPKQYKQVHSKIMSLMINPRPNDSIQMKGREGRFRADIGEFRVIYSFDDDEVDIVLVGKRNDDEVYK